MLVKDRVSAAISQARGDQPFAWMGTRTCHDDYLGTRRSGDIGRTARMGLNCFQHLHNVVVVSALNPSPAHFRFMAGSWCR